MAEKKTPGAIVPAKVKDVVVAAVGELSAADAMAALTKLVEAVKVHEVESTKREKLRVYEKTEVARINASRTASKSGRWLKVGSRNESSFAPCSRKPVTSASTCDGSSSRSPLSAFG